jgi:hypothetical protein
VQSDQANIRVLQQVDQIVNLFFAPNNREELGWKIMG